MANFEDNFLMHTFNENSGNLLEKNLLATIDDNNYKKNLQEKLEEVFITQNYSTFKSSNDPVGLLLELKKRSPEKYQELKKEHASEIKNFIEERISKNRHKFLNELSVEEQFKIIEKSQPKNSDPTEPMTSFADDLHATIVDELGIDYENLEYYTAVNSHLDYCGVDAFLKFKYLDSKGKEKETRICLDITKNSMAGKMEQQKEKARAGGKSLSDIVVFAENENYSRKRPEDHDLMEKTAKEIIKIYKQKIEGRN
ncbi:MAG TPA: hypothetical protein PK142_02175 [bacterium]|nr:hypothetical protein [bacterium]